MTKKKVIYQKCWLCFTPTHPDRMEHGLCEPCIRGRDGRSKMALFPGGPEIESADPAPFSSQERAQLRTLSLVTLFDSGVSILPLLQTRSPEVIEVFRDFCACVSDSPVELQRFPDTLRKLADEIAFLSSRR